jgi:hypothetical protein
MTFYVDGNVVPGFPVMGDDGGAPIADASYPATIGSSFDDSAIQTFDGLIDEVETFNRVLTADEIAAIVDAGNGGKCKTPTQLANISARASVRTGDEVAIAGFIIQSDPGPTSRGTRGPGVPTKRVLIRGIGPSLTTNGVDPLADRLLDPVLDLHDQNGVLIASNDDWKVADGFQTETDITDTGLKPKDDHEAALLRTLVSGNAYTAVLRGKDANGDPASGIGLVEVYDLEFGTNTHLANLSTRAFVDVGDNVLIGGIIVKGGEATRFLFRAIGPSLESQGLPPGSAVPDPQLDIHDGQGMVVAHNDNWKEEPDGTPNGTREAEINATGLAPGNDSEAAIIYSPAPGDYTAIVSGLGADQDGIGMVEVYEIGPPPPTWYQDADSDGYGNPFVTQQATSAPPGYVANNTDCDDANANVHPGAPEICDGKDNNCNGIVDEGCD